MSKFSLRHTTSSAGVLSFGHTVVLPLLVCWSLQAKLFNHQVFMQGLVSCCLIAVFAWRYVHRQDCSSNYELDEQSSGCRLSVIQANGTLGEIRLIGAGSKIMPCALLVQLNQTLNAGSLGSHSANKRTHLFTEGGQGQSKRSPWLLVHPWQMSDVDYRRLSRAIFQQQHA